MNNRVKQGEEGRASLEFLVAAIVVFIPVLSLTVVLWSVSHAQLATEAAARHAARVFVQHTSIAQAVGSTERAARHTLDQFGINDEAAVTLRCSPSNNCLGPDSWVEVVVTTNVSLVSLTLGGFAASVPIAARATSQVSHYRGDP
jgi:type II secretory pathway pseudopilin PulG